ncbi:hypothetical protein K469DRAFT_124627 [Zopfia rhizophila CBS 207.26]|uniref:Uncharacterized protein n=1 Tax=Zopfia rhizophila CBS 207.26 TaxID=1314779 RepID=A0A6A6E7Z8_9PEZI|nr:hypothetical protein K469DRAFT_124627 [Zopfia rhizophila CBS 207.26]
MNMEKIKLNASPCAHSVSPPIKMQLSTLFSAFLLLGRAMGAAVPEPAGKAIKVAKDQTPAPTRNCLHTKCKCWGNPGTWKTAKLYCGYCEDVVPVTGGPNLHGNEMFACGPGPDQCCDMGYSDTCQNLPFPRLKRRRSRLPRA